MDFARFKHFIRQHNDTLILFEQGEPEIVMMSFAEYERLISRKEGNERDRTPARERNDFVMPRQEASGLAAEDAPNPMDDPSRDAEWPQEADAVSPAAQAFPHAITTPSSSRAPIRLEDVQLEDLPIEGF